MHASKTIHPFSLFTQACCESYYLLNVFLHLSYLTGVCQALTASATVIRVNVSSTTTAGAVASYECVAGYTLEGSSTRTCQNDGSWSGSEPTCISKLLRFCIRNKTFPLVVVITQSRLIIHLFLYTVI